MKARFPCALLHVLLFLLLAAAGVPAETAAPGVVVEEIGPGSALERAGLRPGDVLVAWERDEEQGEIRTPFDWMWVMAEQAPRGSVRLLGERDASALSFAVLPGIWDSRVRPRTATETWTLFEAAAALAKEGHADKARESLQAALAQASDAQARVAILEALAEGYQYTNRMPLAEASLRSALEAGETAWGESLQVAGTTARLGNVLRLQGRLDEAARLQEGALLIRQRQAPDSLEVADSLHQLFMVAWERRDQQAMAEHARRGMALQERWPSDSLAMADTLNDQALVAFDGARYGEAVAALRRALSILERRSPGSIPLATSLARLGWMFKEMGDAESAMELLRRAQKIRERLAPESLGTAAILNSLGMIAAERGDLAAAEELFRRSLEIRERAAPHGPGVAVNLDLLGTVARMRGDLDGAWDLHHRALDLRERFLNHADEAYTLGLLGLVAEERGDLKAALDLSHRAHALYEQRAPGTIGEILALQQLGRLYRRTGRPGQAAQLLARAVEALESRDGGFGSQQDLQAMFRARHEEIYHDAIEAELERGRAAAAFHLLERSRARSFLMLLAKRDIAFAGELPAALESSRRDNAAGYDRTLQELARWTPAAGDAAREALRNELHRLRRERETIAAEIRTASPRLAALRQPQPLDLEAAAGVLDPGTLALSYSVGKDKTVLFALTREGGLQVKTLPLGEERLRRDVESFLDEVRQPGSGSPGGLSRSLYRDLIGPVSELVERGERILILPGGPLHRLPFGALVRDPGSFLTEWKPLHTALSLTVYGTLRAAAPAPGAASGPRRLVAFGDPSFPGSMQAKGDLSPGLRRFDWSSLPWSRAEVERIAGIYPGASLYLGEEATEERAKSLGRDARILHFATHGYTDDRIPLDSALVLTIPEELRPGQDNGLLQVWEIFESVRLDADLVVLSACESALGRELSGEGLIGLTRAFQYAGARSVVASLWSVADQVTAELMARFHRHLVAGLPKDQALRAAQLELIREPVRITTAKGQAIETDASAPFFWAAFQLFGDWR